MRRAPPPAALRERIRAEVERCLRAPERPQPCALPPRFETEVVCKDARHAWRKSFYPGARPVDPNTIGFDTGHCFELLRMLQFITREQRWKEARRDPEALECAPGAA
ncbi:MAG TPA: M55 family metallopeptidase [Rubrivivax sp.]|nr:M55 family metallopeptidase [Rubrivivax sp.]